MTYTPLSDKRIAEIKARCDAAFDGPWHLHGSDVYDKISTAFATVCFPANRDFIAHSRTDLPDVLADLAHWKAEAERFRNIVERLGEENLNLKAGMPKVDGPALMRDERGA